MKVLFESKKGDILFSNMHHTREGEKLFIEVKAGTYQISEEEKGYLLITPIEDK